MTDRIPLDKLSTDTLDLFPSSTSSPESAGSPSASNPSDWKDELLLTGLARRSEQSDSLRSTDTPAPSSPDTGPTFPISATSATSRAIQSYAYAVSCRLSSLVDFLASRTVSPESERPLMTTEICGPNASAFFGSYDPSLPSSKTSPDSSRPVELPRMVSRQPDFFSIAFCQIWPRSGMLASGRLYQLPTLALPINANASGSSASTNWLTPHGLNNEQGQQGGEFSKQVTNWPTASARDWKDTSGMSMEGVNPDGSTRKRTDQLARRVFAEDGPHSPDSGPPDQANAPTAGSRPASSWATPTADDANNATRKSGVYQSLTRQAGKLCAEWVESLLGFPIGWTEVP